jgi:hypothetical protein
VSPPDNFAFFDGRSTEGPAFDAERFIAVVVVVVVVADSESVVVVVVVVTVCSCFFKTAATSAWRRIAVWRIQVHTAAGPQTFDAAFAGCLCFDS